MSWLAEQCKKTCWKLGIILGLSQEMQSLVSNLGILSRADLHRKLVMGVSSTPVLIQLATDMEWYLMVSRKPWKSSKDSARRGGTARSFLHSGASETKTNSTCMFSLWENRVILLANVGCVVMLNSDSLMNSVQFVKELFFSRSRSFFWAVAPKVWTQNLLGSYER